MSGHPGPWNAEVRRMAAELRSAVGADFIVRDLVGSGRSCELLQVAKNAGRQGTRDADGRASSASSEELDRAREVIETLRSGASSR